MKMFFPISTTSLTVLPVEVSWAFLTQGSNMKHRDQISYRAIIQF